MDVRNILFTQDRAPGRHGAAAMKHRFPEKILLFQNRIFRELGSHSPACRLTVTGSAVVLEDAGASAGHADEPPNGSTFLTRCCWRSDFRLERRQAVGHARVIACGKV